MPVDDDDLDLNDEQNQDVGDSEPTFTDWLDRGMFAIGTAKKDRDAAESFVARYSKPEDFLEPGADEDLASVREISPQTADALERFRDDARAEQERVREAEATSARERRLAELKTQREQERREADEKERQAALDRELLAQLEAEERAAAGPDAVPEDDRHLETIKAGSDAAQAWRRGELNIEEAREAAQKGIAAAAALEQGSSFRVDRNALDAAVAAKLKEE